MISPIEVKKKEFGRTLRGYNQEEVDQFLGTVADEFEKMYKENAELREALQRAETDMSKYRKLEDTLNQTLLMAQTTADEIKSNARREASAIMEGARYKIQETFVVYEEILKRLNVFRTEIKSYLNSQVEFMDRHDKRIDDLTSMFYAQDTKNLLGVLDKKEHKPDDRA